MADPAPSDGDASNRAVPVSIIAGTQAGTVFFASGRRLALLSLATQSLATFEADGAAPEADAASPDQGFGHSGVVRAVGVGGGGRLLASVDDTKGLKTWEVSESDDGTLKVRLTGQTLTTKRATAVAWAPDASTLVCVDKNGDGYMFEAGDLTATRQILGHYSLVTDVVFTPSGASLITCDRDDHIRIAAYPRAYNIEGFCQGHTDFVTRLVIPFDDPESLPVLVSGAGDGTIRTWDYAAQRPLGAFQALDGSPAAVPFPAIINADGTPDEPSPVAVVDLAFSGVRNHLAAIVLSDDTDVVTNVFSLDPETGILSFVQTLPAKAAAAADDGGKPLAVAFDSEGRLWVSRTDARLDAPLMTLWAFDGAAYAPVGAGAAGDVSEAVSAHLRREPTAQLGGGGGGGGGGRGGRKVGETNMARSVGDANKGRRDDYDVVFVPIQQLRKKRAAEAGGPDDQRPRSKRKKITGGKLETPPAEGGDGKGDQA